jgi:PrgI family protein
MPVPYHEVPTHLDVEDKVVFGLTARQFLYVLVGSSATYSLWEQTAWLHDPLRIAMAVLSIGTTLLFALWRPSGRPLEEWLAAACVYVASPGAATWQPTEPLASDWLPSGPTWQELSPSLAWAPEDDTE